MTHFWTWESDIEPLWAGRGLSGSIRCRRRRAGVGSDMTPLSSPDAGEPIR